LAAEIQGKPCSAAHAGRGLRIAASVAAHFIDSVSTFTVSAHGDAVDITAIDLRLTAVSQ
jgi:hypothetical protein